MASTEKTLIKVVILGNVAVGKTSLLKRYIDHTFSTSYKTSIGVDILTKDLMVNDREVTMQMWDTAGQETYRSLGFAFYRGADCCVLVFDVASRSSFRSLNDWRDEFLVHCSSLDTKTFPFVVLGNKVDLARTRVISSRRALLWCEENGGIPFFETSAKDGNNVDFAFKTIAQKSLEAQSFSNVLVNDFNSFTITLKDVEQQKSSCTCHPDSHQFCSR